MGREEGLALNKFTRILSTGIKGGAVKKDMTFRCFYLTLLYLLPLMKEVILIFCNRFDAPGNGQLNIAIDGEVKGAISNPNIVKAFFGIYVDKNTVSPALKESLSTQISKWLK